MSGPRCLAVEQVLLTTLVVKLAVVAALATMLVRYRRFRHILIFERRDWPDRLIFILFFGVPLAAGVGARLLLNYQAADLSLEGAFVTGLVAGPYAGAVVGALTGLPRRVWKMLRTPQVDWQLVLLFAPIGLELIRQVLGARWHANHRLFYLSPMGSIGMMLLVLLATMLSVATPIKIWNNARIEHRLQEQETLLLAAKIEALSNQINPHFLFNTLASISSLIRTQPETARMLITKLSGLLRRLLRSTDHFVTLRDEIDAIDEYLHIESVRFGPQLRVEKRIHPDTLDVIVPSLILQPLVENSIKHGLSPKVGGGRITITS